MGFLAAVRGFLLFGEGAFVIRPPSLGGSSYPELAMFVPYRAVDVGAD